MRLTFLGTAASESFPNAFCDCRSCVAARLAGGRNIRRRSAALIDTQLLIDAGPDIMNASAAFNISLHGIRYLLQTHEHQDHLDLSHFYSRCAHCGVPEVGDLIWYASGTAANHAASRLRPGSDASLFDLPEFVDSLNLRHQPVAINGTISIGSYSVLSVPANHGTGIDAMLHAIESNGRRLFYATDTGPLPESTWRTLSSEGWSFDVVVMDFTFGLGRPSTGHLNADQFADQISEMKRFGLIRSDTRVFATHIAHHSNPLHDELVCFANDRGFEIAYDGLSVDI